MKEIVFPIFSSFFLLSSYEPFQRRYLRQVAKNVHNTTYAHYIVSRKPSQHSTGIFHYFPFFPQRKALLFYYFYAFFHIIYSISLQPQNNKREPVQLICCNSSLFLIDIIIHLIKFYHYLMHVRFPHGICLADHLRSCRHVLPL